MDFAIIKSYIEYGIFAGLFIALLAWVVKHQDKLDSKSDVRETELRRALDRFADCYQNLSMDSNKIAHTIHENVTELSNDVDTLHGKVVTVENKVIDIDKKVDKLGDKVDNIFLRVKE